MKTTMKQLTAGTFLALLLVVGNVQAKGTEAKASDLENIETELKLENWMINDRIWNNETVFFIEEASDETLEVENWMTDKCTWKVKPSFNLETAKDETLEIEGWMTADDNWNK